MMTCDSSNGFKGSELPQFVHVSRVTGFWAIIGVVALDMWNTKVVFDQM